MDEAPMQIAGKQAVPDPQDAAFDIRIENMRWGRGDDRGTVKREYEPPARPQTRIALRCIPAMRSVPPPACPPHGTDCASGEKPCGAAPT